MNILNLFKRKNQEPQPKEDLEKEMKRRKNQANQILNDFVNCGSLTTIDLGTTCFRYSARIGELRKRGYKIDCKYERPGVYRYTYGGFQPKMRITKHVAGS